MGLPGLRGPPGTKVSHILTTSFTQFMYVFGKYICYIPVYHFRVCPVTKERRLVLNSLS